MERRPDLVEEFVTWLLTDTRLSPSSVRRVHATLRAAFNTAVKRKLLAHNPALAVELPEPSTARAGGVDQ